MDVTYLFILYQKINIDKLERMTACNLQKAKSLTFVEGDVFFNTHTSFVCVLNFFFKIPNF